VWIVIAGASLSDLAAGIVAVTIATWVSLVLHPPGAQRIKLVPLMHLGARLLLDSVLAGSDVARRALDPRLPLHPGLIRYPTLLAPGPAQAALKTMICLVPGTLSIGSAPDETLLIHCLDVAQLVAPGLARNEALLLGALGRKRPDA
jgi:multicomponent Na+:H+ antiporter subunit E